MIEMGFTHDSPTKTSSKTLAEEKKLQWAIIM